MILEAGDTEVVIYFSAECVKVSDIVDSPTFLGAKMRCSCQGIESIVLVAKVKYVQKS